MNAIPEDPTRRVVGSSAARTRKGSAKEKRDRTENPIPLMSAAINESSQMTLAAEPDSRPVGRSGSRVSPQQDQPRPNTRIGSANTPDAFRLADRQRAGGGARTTTTVRPHGALAEGGRDGGVGRSAATGSAAGPQSGPVLGNSANNSAGFTNTSPDLQKRPEKALEGLAGQRSELVATAALSAEERAKLEARQGRKRLRFELRGCLWDISSLARVAMCGKYVREDGRVEYKLMDNPDGTRSAGFGGLQSCGSAHACPVCAAKIARRRFEEIDELLRAVVGAGDTVAHMVPTVQHHAGMTLEESWNAIQKAWAWVGNHREWTGDSEAECDAKMRTWRKKLAYAPNRRPREGEYTYARRCAYREKKLRETKPVRQTGLRDDFGVMGFSRTFEALYGKNGWHPHFHILMVFSGQHEHDEDGGGCPIETAFADRFWTLWEKAIKRQGLNVIRDVFNPKTGRTDAAGFSVTCSSEEATRQAAAYMVKQMSLEVTHGQQSKDGKFGSRTPFQLLADAVSRDDLDALARWHEWEQVSQGRRQTSWSGDLRKMYGLEEEEDDQDIVDEDLGTEAILEITAGAWAKIRHEQVELLIVGEDHGLDAAVNWLEQRGIKQGLGYVRGPDSQRSA